MDDFCLKINPEDLKSSKISVTAKEAKIMFDKHVTADKVELMIGDDFEVKEEDGKWFVVKKQSKYPKTYDECCKVLQMPKDESYIDIDVPLSYNKVLKSFTQLLICRDAYWKLAGDWKPEFKFGKKKYCIMTKDNRVITATVEETNRILAFPTEKMRDTFYENFKDLIEVCKELL